MMHGEALRKAPCGPRPRIAARLVLRGPNTRGAGAKAGSLVTCDNERACPPQQRGREVPTDRIFGARGRGKQGQAKGFAPQPNHGIPRRRSPARVGLQCAWGSRRAH
jgi:hypothetical protein